MSQYRCKMIINVFCEAETPEAAADIFGDAGILITDSNDGSELESEVVDWSLEPTGL